MNVSKSLKKTLPFLRIVSTLSLPNRKKILKNLNGDKNVYDSLYELAHNSKKGFFKNKSRKLKPFRNLIDSYCNSTNRNCRKKRINLLGQSGGLIGAIIPLLLSVLPKLLNSD